MAGRLQRSLELLTAGARDLPARQQTLQATLDWSYELLEPAERELFARLAAFQGGCTVEAVEAIAAGSLDQLGSLVDKSLLRRVDGRTGPRFAMLETIREYAGGRLRECGAEEDARRRHAAYFLRVAEAAASSTSSGNVTDAAIAAFDAEHDNFRAALAWTASAGEVEGELRLAVALSWFWMMRGDLTEARRTFEGVIERSASADPSLRASALVRAGIFPYRQGDVARARELWTEAHELFLELGDEKEAARCLAELASVAIAEGDLDRAVQLYEEAADHFRAQAQPTRLGIVLSNLGAVASLRADFDAAARYQEEAIALQRDIDERDTLSISLYNLARTEIKRGRREAARELLPEALRLANDLGYKEVIAHCLQGAAELVADRDPEWAARACGASLALFDEIGVSLAGDADEDYRDLRGRLVAALGERRLDELLAEGRNATREAIVAEALASGSSGSRGRAGSR
jgi:tetratricopeptide (TPR) repeat protein